MSDNYPIPTDAPGYLRREAKRAMQNSRRPAFRGIREELGPGFAPRAVQILDWNSEEATFNGYFWSAPGALSSPDTTTRWLGEVWAQDDFNGVQTIREAEPPAGTVPEPDPDPPAPVPSEGDPEPEPPTEGNLTPIRSYTRYYSISPDQSITFTDWEPTGYAAGGALRDLSDVKIFDPLKQHDILMWNEEFNDGEGAWINYSWVPGINDLNNRLDDLLEEFENEIDFQGSIMRVWRQPEPPVPGDPGPPPVPDPIPIGSFWFDTDDDNHMRTWDPSSPEDPYLLHWVDLDATLSEEIEQAIADAQADATQALADAADAFDAATTASADAAAATAAAQTATDTAADAIEAASLAAILGDNIITNGEFNVPSTIGDPISLWTPANAATLTRWNDVADYGIKVTTGANTIGEVTQQGELGKIPARGGEGFHITASVATTAGGQSFRMFANTYDAAGAYVATVFTTTQTAASGGQSGSSNASQNAHITIPGNPTFVRFGIQFQAASTDFWVSRYTVAESVGTTRITDDAITTPKINTNAVTTDELSATAITSKHTMVAPTYKTASVVGAGAPGLLLNSAGLVAYANSGPTLTITAATGAISMLGSLTTGSDITGATVTASTINGGLIQTTTTASRGVKINSSGLIGYNSSGSPTFSLDATTGALTLLGTIQSGSNISGATLTGILQTSPSANVGVKISNSGIYGYNAAGTNVFALNTAGTTGNLTLTGSVVSGGEINGALITGTGIQTSQANVGIKMNSAGLLAYSSAGALNLSFVTSTGSLAMKGSLTSGSTITGATVTGTEILGGMVRAGTVSGGTIPYSNAIHMGFSDAAVLGMKVFDPSGNMVLYIRPDISSSTATLSVIGGADYRPHPSFVPPGQPSTLRVRAGVGFQVDSGAGFNVYTQAYFNSDVTYGTLAGGRIDSNSVVAAQQLEAAGHNTTGNNANCYIRNTDGRLLRSTASAMRFKENIADLDEEVDAASVVALRPVAFNSLLPDDDGARFTGFIADEAEELGLEKWVGYDEEGRVETFNYSGFCVAQQIVLRSLWEQVQDLKAQIRA